MDGERRLTKDVTVDRLTCGIGKSNGAVDAPSIEIQRKPIMAISGILIVAGRPTPAVVEAEHDMTAHGEAHHARADLRDDARPFLPEHNGLGGRQMAIPVQPKGQARRQGCRPNHAAPSTCSFAERLANDTAAPDNLPSPFSGSHGALRQAEQSRRERTVVRISGWLSDRPHRCTMLNLVMLALLLALIGSPGLFQIVGGGAIALLGLIGLKRTVPHTIQEGWRSHLYELLRIWAPGGIAILLAVFGLWLIQTSALGGMYYVVGVVLFGFETAALALLGADLAPPVPEAR